MRILVAGNVIACPHPPGVGSIVPSQSLIRVESKPIVVQPDPIRAPIAGCPNVAIPNVPCATTLTAEQVSFSQLVFIDGSPVCLDTTTGITSGSPPGIAKYTVKTPGQSLVETNA